MRPLSRRHKIATHGQGAGRALQRREVESGRQIRDHNPTRPRPPSGEPPAPEMSKVTLTCTTEDCSATWEGTPKRVWISRPALVFLEEQHWKCVFVQETHKYVEGGNTIGSPRPTSTASRPNSTKAS